MSFLAYAAGGHRAPQHAQTDVIDRFYAEQNAPKLDVASFNIAASRVSDLDSISKAILALDADIVALQEIEKYTGRSMSMDQPGRLAELTGLNIEFARAIDFDGGHYGLAIASRHTILNVQIIPLPSDDREQRILLIAKIKVPGFESPVMVFNTHLDTAEDPQVRLQQVRKINEIAIDTRGIKVLLGDINDVPESIIYRELSRYWNDALPDFADRRTWPAINPEIQVDYVFTSKAQSWQTSHIIPNKHNRYGDIDWPAVSDHLPVVVKMKMLEQ